MPESFTIIVSIASTTQKFGKDDRAQAVRHFNFELEKKLKMHVHDLIITLILQRGRLFFI